MFRKQLKIWMSLATIVLSSLCPRAIYAQDSGQAPKSPMNVDGMAALADIAKRLSPARKGALARRDQVRP